MHLFKKKKEKRKEKKRKTYWLNMIVRLGNDEILETLVFIYDKVSYLYKLRNNSNWIKVITQIGLNSVNYLFKDFWKMKGRLLQNLVQNQLYSYFCYWTKFDNKLDHSLRLQLYSISFCWMWILTNLQLDYIFFLYPPCLQNF